MAAKRVNVADELLASLREAADIVVGKVAPSRTWRAPYAVDAQPDSLSRADKPLRHTPLSSGARKPADDA